MLVSTNRCGGDRRIRAGSTKIVLALAWLVLLVFIGAGSYFAVSQIALKRQAAKSEPATAVAPPEPDQPIPTEPDGKNDAAAREKAAEEARKDAERQKLEA